MSLKKEEFYATQDLIIGNRVSIFGRDCLIYDADDFTMKWYEAAYGIQMVPIQVKKVKTNLVYQPLAKYNGYGTEEDSLGSIYSLQPKPPKIDIKKVFKQDMHILRFEAKVVSTEPDDESRDFIISFYCGDDTI